MAYFIAAANGNWLTAATWGTVDATSLLDSQANTTSSTTSYVESSSFTPGAITVDGIAIKIGNHSSSPTGTISARIAQGGTTVTGTEVTINSSDLPSGSSLTNNTNFTSVDEVGWVFFKFASPVTLIAATAYTVSIKSSSAGQISMYRDATAGNWSRMLRTTTTGTPAAGDNVVVGKEYTGAGTSNTRTVTMNETGTTDYGSASTSSLVAAVDIVSGGTLTFDNSISTNLRVSGHIIVRSGGTLSIGTSGSPIPAAQTAKIELDCASAGDFCIMAKNGSTINMQGSPRTAGKLVTWTKLTSDLAAAGTTVNVAADTGWKNGDVVALTPTSRTPTQREEITLNADAGASSLAWTTGVTNAHSGTSPAQGEAALLTRNVKITVTGSARAFCYWGNTATIDLDWTEFQLIGVDSSKTAWNIDTTTGSFAANYCSVWNSTGYQCLVNAANTTSGTRTIQDCVFYRGSGSANVWISSVNQPTTVTFQRNLICSNTSNETLSIQVGAYGWTGEISGNCMSGSTNYGCNYNCYQILASQFHDNEAHTNSALGFYFAGGHTKRSSGNSLSNLKAWRNNGGLNSNNAGIEVQYINNGWGIITIDNPVLFGNGIQNLLFDGKCPGGFIINNGIFGGDTSFSTTTNIFILDNVNTLLPSQINNSSFSQVSGLLTAATVDISLGTSSAILVYAPIVADNTKFGAATVISNLSTFVGTDNIYLRSQRQDQTDNNHREYTPIGNRFLNSTTYNSAAPSEELVPSSASYKFKSSPKRVSVTDGNTRTISVYVRKGSGYTGAQPRLILAKQDSIGISSDTVLATMTVGTGTWEQLSGTTPAALENGAFEVYVDCDTGGASVYVDDWAVT